MRDLWDDIPTRNTLSNERLGYPTQKPLALLNSIIEASSNAGDVVFDPFCGCATTLVAADRLQRKWVGCDISPLAAQLVVSRIKADQELFEDITECHEPPVRSSQDPMMQLWIKAEKPTNPQEHKHILYGQQHGKCNGCRLELPYRLMEVDHIIPQSKNGSDEKHNLQLLCSSCNRIKSTGTPEDLLARLRENGTIRY